MKPSRLLFFFYFVFFVSGFIAETNAIKTNNVHLEKFQKNYSHESNFESCSETQTDHKILHHPFDIRKYKLEIEPDLFSGRVDATVTIDIITKQKNINKILLNFVGLWDIAYVKVNDYEGSWLSPLIIRVFSGDTLTHFHVKCQIMSTAC